MIAAGAYPHDSRSALTWLVEQKDAKVTLVATGAEVGLAVDAAKQLSGGGVPTRVVSMPCTSVFDAQDEAYRESVLPAGVTARVAVEAAVKESFTSNFP